MYKLQVSKSDIKKQIKSWQFYHFYGKYIIEN